MAQLVADGLASVAPLHMQSVTATEQRRSQADELSALADKHFRIRTDASGYATTTPGNSNSNERASAATSSGSVVLPKHSWHIEIPPSPLAGAGPGSPLPKSLPSTFATTEAPHPQSSPLASGTLGINTGLLSPRAASRGGRPSASANSLTSSMSAAFGSTSVQLLPSAPLAPATAYNDFGIVSSTAVNPAESLLPDDYTIDHPALPPLPLELL